MAFLHQGNIHVKRIEEPYPKGFSQDLATHHVAQAHWALYDEEAEKLSNRTLAAARRRIETTRKKVEAKEFTH